MVDHGLAGRRVLIVEDDYYLAMELSDTLNQAGAVVVGPFATVRGALDSLDEAPEAAVLDLRLIDETSLPIARELLSRRIPYLFTTGLPSELPSAHGAHSVLPKPANEIALLRALDDALAA